MSVAPSRDDDGSDGNGIDESQHQSWLRAKKDFGAVLDRLQQLPAAAGAKLQGSFAQRLLDRAFTVDTPRGPIEFVLLGKTAAGRATTLLTKQPATIDWIDGFAPASVFWDIGANVGVYTLYAALRADTRVVAFEPAAVNHFLLAANIEANHLNDRVKSLLTGLGEGSGLARFEVSQFESGKSFSSRERADRQRRAGQMAMVVSMDQLVEEFELACPNYIKIDVPAMTEQVITGGMRMLRRADVRELHIELRAESSTGQRIVAMLDDCGFEFGNRDRHGRSADVTFIKRG